MKMLKWIGFILGILLILPTLFVYIGGYYDKDFLQTAIEASAKEDQEGVVKEELIGILAKEIPTTYEYEAIKAQTVIIRTYISRRKLGVAQKGDLKALTTEEMKNAWGDDYKKYYSLFESAIEATKNEVIYYDNQMIEPVYHRASAGKTRTAKAVYGVDIPYLQPVESAQDQIGEDVVVDKADMVNKLKKDIPDLVAYTEGLENQIQIVKRDESGYITSIQIGNILMTGEKFRTLMNIPSSNFEIEAKEKRIVLKTKGVGHGVGLSQNGANLLAKQGKNYKEILGYYFKDVKVDTLEK